MDDEDAIVAREAGLLKALTRGQIIMIGLGGPSAPASSWAAASPSATRGRASCSAI